MAGPPGGLHGDVPARGRLAHLRLHEDPVLANDGTLGLFIVSQLEVPLVVGLTRALPSLLRREQDDRAWHRLPLVRELAGDRHDTGSPTADHDKAKQGQSQAQISFA